MGENKRRMLTPAERVAKLQAELAEAQAKAEVKDRKRYTELGEQREKLVAQIEERTDKVEAIDTERAQIEVRVPGIGQPSLAVVGDAEAQAI